MRRKLILIGASTGGPGHLKEIFASLNEDFSTPIIVAQHMNRSFISTFVSQFDSEYGLNFVVGNDDMEIKERYVYICSENSVVRYENSKLILKKSYEKSLYNPCINILFNSITKLDTDLDIFAALLTGIGDDGAEGLSNLEKRGAACFAENEESSVVYGMPKKAVEFNKNVKSKNLSEIIEEINEFDKKRYERI